MKYYLIITLLVSATLSSCKKDQVIQPTDHTGIYYGNMNHSGFYEYFDATGEHDISLDTTYSSQITVSLTGKDSIEFTCDGISIVWNPPTIFHFNIDFPINQDEFYEDHVERLMMDRRH